MFLEIDFQVVLEDTKYKNFFVILTIPSIFGT